MGFLEPDVADLVAVTGVPAERRAPEAAGIVDQEQDELERVREADEVELGRRGERQRRVPRVERPAELCVGGAFVGHEHMFPHVRADTDQAQSLGSTRSCSSAALKATKSRQWGHLKPRFRSVPPSSSASKCFPQCGQSTSNFSPVSGFTRAQVSLWP